MNLASTLIVIFQSILGALAAIFITLFYVRASETTKLMMYDHGMTWFKKE